MPREEANGRDRASFKPMKTHTEVIENFIRKGVGSKGTFLKATDEVLYSTIPQYYRPYGNYESGTAAGQSAPLAVRLENGGILANGARYRSPISVHQWRILKSLETSEQPFGVVPFHSIVAAFTDGKENDWDRHPIPISDLRKDVEVVVPSAGEHWKDVEVKDAKGHAHTRTIHTLGDSVLRIKDSYFLSGVDETGEGNGMYFFAELVTDRAPLSVEDALNFLKPSAVREAEEKGSNVLRQGEWFAIPTKLLTSELMRDVDEGLAGYRKEHILGRDGHHRLEEAVIYRAGERKGQVFARGVMKHTQAEHVDLDLGTQRWYLIVHNIVGASYTLSGKGTAQFD
jgi:hypothetical protein